MLWCNVKESRYRASKYFGLKSCKVVLVTRWGKKTPNPTVFFIVSKEAPVADFFVGVFEIGNFRAWV